MSGKQAAGASSTRTATSVPQTSALVDATKPSTTAFGCALDSDLRLVQVLTNGASKHTTLGDKTKAAVQDVLKDAQDQLTALAQSLDDLHMGLCDLDPSGALRPAQEERLRKASDVANSIATGLRTTQSKSSELAKQRAAVNELQKRISKLQQQHQEYAKVSAQLQTVSESAVSRLTEASELEVKVKERKRDLQAKEAEITRAREEKQKEVQVLKAEFDRIKTPVKKGGAAETKSRAEELRTRIKLLKERLESIRADVAQNEAILNEEPENQVMNEKELEKEQNAQVVLDASDPGPDDLAEQCGVCTRWRLVDDMVMLFHCMHYVCRDCMKAELNECRQNNRSFKFAICPSCAEDVEMFDGTGISGSVKLNKDHIIVPVLTEES